MANIPQNQLATPYLRQCARQIELLRSKSSSMEAVYMGAETCHGVTLFQYSVTHIRTSKHSYDVRVSYANKRYVGFSCSCNRSNCIHQQHVCLKLSDARKTRIPAIHDAEWDDVFGGGEVIKEAN